MDKITSPKVFVIILNYNGIETLNACLASVFRSDYRNIEVVVVDNDSTDGSFENARSHFSRANFIKNSANVGFSQGNNVGIRFALEKFADFVFILNNDTVIETNTITSLVEFFSKNTRAGIASPLISGPDANTIWFAGGNILWDKMKNIHVTEIFSENPYPSEFISGCAMFVKKEVFQKIGLFDERYFLYYEDADFSLRSKKAGFDLFIVPSAKIIHFEKSTGNDSKNYWLVLSGLIFFFAHSTLKQKFYLYPYFFLRRMKNLCDVIFRTSSTAKNIRRAYKDYKNTANISN